MTNREWLFTLSDEELVLIFQSCRCCVYHGDFTAKRRRDRCLMPRDKSCDDGVIEWLKREH